MTYASNQCNKPGMARQEDAKMWVERRWRDQPRQINHVSQSVREPGIMHGAHSDCPGLRSQRMGIVPFMIQASRARAKVDPGLLRGVVSTNYLPWAVE